MIRDRAYLCTFNVLIDWFTCQITRETYSEKEILGTTTYRRGGKKAESGEERERKVDPWCRFKEVSADSIRGAEAGWPFRAVQNNSGAGPLYTLVDWILDAWTRWSCLAEANRKEG